VTNDFETGLFAENERTAPAESGRRFASVGPIGELHDVTVCYETWGTLNQDRSNAILIQHALSGDSHAIGWWSGLIGPGKPIDTDQFFVIGHNALGGCQGTTGPSSLAPDGRPWGSRFPKVTVEQMIEAQFQLVGGLGIETLHAVAGGSMGGMMALEWARRPNLVRKAFVTASAAAHSAMQIGFNETARQAIRRDPKFRGGDYPAEDPPRDGLAVARMVGHLSYLSEAAFQHKFGREVHPEKGIFQVESYLNYQGDKFNARFDANSLIVLTEAIDAYALPSLEASTAEFLFVSFASDWLYPPHQSAELHALAQAAGCTSRYENIDLPWGHDAFLLDGEIQGAYVREFLTDLA
jgi:homoserine O-acetyltransferase/O-succinyltransferase